MRCKYCAYNYVSYCSIGVYNSNNEYFKKHNDSLGCAGGKVDSNMIDKVKTKNQILEEIEKAIQSYDNKNQLVDVMFWSKIKGEIEEFLL